MKEGAREETDLMKSEENMVWSEMNLTKDSMTLLHKNKVKGQQLYLENLKLSQEKQKQLKYVDLQMN